MSDKKEAQTKYVDNTFRKKWDKELYEQRARDREAGLLVEEEDEESKRKRIKLEQQAKQPLGHLTARDKELDLDSKLGKTSVVEGITPLDKQGGFYCDKCEMLFKDSSSWLDHINGKKHNAMIGNNMRVETSTLSAVQLKLRSQEKKSSAPLRFSNKRSKPDDPKEDLKEDPKEDSKKESLKIEKKQEVIAKKKEEERKEEKSEEKETKEEEKLDKKEEEEQVEENSDKVEYEYEDNEDYSYLGLTDFGSSKKNR